MFFNNLKVKFKVIALVVLVITLCSRRSTSEARPKNESDSHLLNVRLNYDRVSNSYQPVILRVESNGVLTDVGTLMPRLVPEDTQSVRVFFAIFPRLTHFYRRLCAPLLINCQMSSQLKVQCNAYWAIRT